MPLGCPADALSLQAFCLATSHRHPASFAGLVGKCGGSDCSGMQHLEGREAVRQWGRCVCGGELLLAGQEDGCRSLEKRGLLTFGTNPHPSKVCQRWCSL